MRLIVEFENPMNVNPYSISKFEIQGFIYHLLKSSRYNFLHDIGGFKFFCFSNIFKNKNKYKLIISSVENKLIRTLYHRLKTIDTFRLGETLFTITDFKTLQTPRRFNYFTTATPILLFRNQTMSNHCYSFKKDNIDYNWFFERLKQNALKKYNAYYDEDYYLNGPLFTSFEYKKEVAMNYKRKSHKFVFVGSLWSRLFADFDKDNHRFYRFLYDTGLGEKNSLGYGFLNNVLG